MKLALFFSRGVSLKLWIDKGLFDREKLLYEKYLNDKIFEKVYWFTYGVEDEKIANQLKKENKLHQDIVVIEMLSIFNIPKVGSYIYSLFLPLLHKKYLKHCEIYKTNQTDGSWSAVIAKRLYKKKLLYRTGYTISQLENKLKRYNIFIRKSIEFFESFAYNNCDRAIVSSKHNMRYIIDKYNLNDKNIDILYNFIDNSRFYDYGYEREEKVIFIGRLSSEKNIFNLIKSLKNINLPLEIYGTGNLENELKKYVSEGGYNVHFMGNVPNNELPDLLNKSKYFALVSEHEGMPKALIEGMSCGCICIGTNVTGINEIILDNNTGYLSKNITYSELEKAFSYAKEQNTDEVYELKERSKKYINNNFTLNSIFENEKLIIRDMVNE